MFHPEAYGIAPMLMLLSMLRWGSWANTQKLAAGYSFQLFYWDYVIGMVLASLLWGFTLGSLVCDRARSHHGVGGLGRIRLARVCNRAGKLTKTASIYVRLHFNRAHSNCRRAHFLMTGAFLFGNRL